MEDEQLVKIIPLTEDQLKEIRDAFALYDTHNSGKISQNRLGNLFSALGVFRTEAEIYEMFAEFELGRGPVLLEEVISVLEVVYQQLYEKHAQTCAFKLINVSESNCLQFADIRNIAHLQGLPLTDQEYDEMCREGDYDNDGAISWDDFLNIINKP